MGGRVALVKVGAGGRLAGAVEVLTVFACWMVMILRGLKTFLYTSSQP